MEMIQQLLKMDIEVHQYSEAHQQSTFQIHHHTQNNQVLTQYRHHHRQWERREYN